MPVAVKFNDKLVDPESHVEGSARLKSFPSVPLATVQPVDGVTVQMNLPGMQVPLSISLASPLVLVNVAVLFTQIVSLGAMENAATGFCET